MYHTVVRYYGSAILFFNNFFFSYKYSVYISRDVPNIMSDRLLLLIVDRSWCFSEKNKRRTLQKEDIQAAIRKTEIFDFLADVIQ